MAYQALTTKTSSDVNASADVNQLQDNIDWTVDQRSQGYTNLLIDGDFNHNQAGFTSATPSSDQYTIDMYKTLVSGGTNTTFSIESHASTVSKPYFFRIDCNTAEDNVGIKQTIKGNIFSGKNISCFMELKYTTDKPSDLQFVIDGQVSSFDISGITTDWQWFRVDMTKTTYSTATSTVIWRNSEDETFDLDINKIRIIVTPENLTSGTIPDYVKEDEIAEVTKLQVQAYILRITNNGTGTMPLTGGRDGSSTNLINIKVSTPVTMINDPTITTNLSSTLNITAGSTVVLSGSESYTLGKACEGCVWFILTDTGKFIANNYYALLLATTQYIQFDARY